MGITPGKKTSELLCKVMWWIRGQQDAPSLQFVNSKLGCQYTRVPVEAAIRPLIYEFTVTHL